MNQPSRTLTTLRYPSKDKKGGNNLQGQDVAIGRSRPQATGRRGRSLPALGSAVAAALFLAPGAGAAPNMQLTVVNGQTDLTASTTYSPAGPPTAANDVVFSGAYSPAAFTINSVVSFGSLNDLSQTALTISATSGTPTLTLGGGTDSVTGSQPADLLYVTYGGSLTISPGAGGLGISLAQSGNFDVAGSATISSGITGTADLTRTGSGNLTLSGGINNGGIFTNSGTAPAVYPSGQVAAPPAGSTYISGTVGANVTGIVQNGTSDLVLNNIGAYNKGITIQNGVVLVSGGGSSLGAATNTITLGNSSTTNATLDYASKVNGTSAGNGSFANPITVGPKTGEGVNVISASDYNLTLTGSISLTNGDLTLAPFNPNNSSITITGGITGIGNLFVSNVANNAGNVVTFSGANAINNTGTITFNNATVNGVTAGAANTGTNTVSANIGLNVSQVIENSTNPLTLSGTNAYTGPTTILRGTISETGGSLASTTLNVGAGTFNYSKTAGTQGFTTTNVTAGATINNTIASTTLNLGTVSRAVGTAVDFGITGTVNIINANTSTTILGGWATTGGGANWAVSAGDGSNAGAVSALSSYTSDTWASGNDTTVTLASNTVTSGTTNSLRFNSNAADTVTLSGTNVITTGGILVTPMVGAFASTIGGTGTLAGSASGELIVNQWNTNAAGTLTISAPIVDNGGATALTKAGPGKLTLSGTNTYTGGTYVSAGTLSVTADGNLGGNGTITLNGGTLQYAAPGGNGHNLTLSPGHILSIGSSGGGVSNTTTTYNSAVVLGTANQLTGSGTLTLTGGGAQADDLAVAASQSGFAGNIVINSGRLEVNTGNATSPLGTGIITITSGATLAFFANVNAIAGANTLPNTIYVAGTGDGQAIHNKSLPGSANAATFSGPIILTNSATVGSDSGATTNFSGGISGAYTLTFGGASTSDIFNLGGVDTETGLTVATTGTVQASGGGTLGASNVALSFTAAGTLDLGGTNQTIGTLSGTTGTILNNGGGASVLTINGGGTSTSVFKDHTSGTGTLGLTVGGGTLALSGANTYSGATTINGGTLLAGKNLAATATGYTGTGTVNINSSGVLGGGTVGTPAASTFNVKGSVNVNAGGTISAGTSALLSPGQTNATANLVTGAQTWNGSASPDPSGATTGTYAWKLNLANNSGASSTQFVSGGALNTDKSGTNWDQLSMSTLAVNGNFNIQVIGLNAGTTGTGIIPFDPGQSYNWVAANVPANASTAAMGSSFVIQPPIGFSSYGSALGVFSASLVSAPTADSSFDDVVISYSPAPEPTSLLMLGLGAGGLMLRRRRRAVLG